MMRFSPHILLLCLCAWSTYAAVKLPLHTSSRWIVDDNNARVKLRCANWAGHMEANVPEGLQHQPVNTIAAWITKNGFNCVRLTYSIDMALGPDLRVNESFANAAEATGASVNAMMALYKKAESLNPWIASSSVLQTFSKVISALEGAGVFVILDNHVSRASWCCSQTDGNGWFKVGEGDADSKYFDTNNWIAGLTAMARFARNHSNVVGLSLRNELRPTGTPDTSVWRKFVTAGATAIHSANPNVLIMVGGISYATDLSWLYSSPLDTSQFANRVVYEFHWYTWFHSGTCEEIQATVGSEVGYLLTQDKPFTGPLWMSEFGIGLDTISASDRAFLDCVVQYMTANDAEWAYWALQGSYYVRDKNVDANESFGLLTSDWSGWRNSEFPSLLGAMWNMTQEPDM